MKNILLLINSISEHPTEDELDVLVQAEAVEKALGELGQTCHRAYFDLDLDRIKKEIEQYSPDIVFNLVESVDGKGSLIHLPASLMESMSIPFTGSGSKALMMTTDKVWTKQILRAHHLPTPDWYLPGKDQQPDPDMVYIIKPILEDGSAGITDASIIAGDLLDYKTFSDNEQFRDHFLETYIDGREFNITLLAGNREAEVMPVAEMCYIDYPANKPKILNYASKWENDSFEYHKTVRSFETAKDDADLIGQMKLISMECWKIFGMRGYMRVDFRVDQAGNPFILEVNANPCISPDAGYVAACEQGGIDYTNMIKRILSDTK